MKKFFAFGLLVLIAATTLALVGSTQVGTAQVGTQPSTVRSSIGVIDLSKVYDEWQYVTNQKKAIDERHKPRFDAIKARAEESQKQKSALLQLEPGTPEYLKLEADLIRSQRNIEVDEGLRQKEYTEELAKVYQDAFTYIKSHTEYIAKAKGISCVIQYNSVEDFKIVNPQTGMLNNTIQNLRSRNVIWHDGAIDLTPLVVNQLNGGKARNQSAATQTSTPAGTTAARTTGLQNR